MPEQEYNVMKSIEAQRAYCKNTDQPLLAPHSGFCWMCGKQIYTAISTEKAGQTLVTYCPHCHKSFND